MPSCRAIADTESPCRCKSKIMTSSPILITVPLLPAKRSRIGESFDLEPSRARPGGLEITEAGEFSNSTNGENYSAADTPKQNAGLCDLRPGGSNCRFCGPLVR